MTYKVWTAARPLSRRKARNRRLRCDCEGWWWFPHRVGSKSLNKEYPGCGKSAPKW